MRSPYLQALLNPVMLGTLGLVAVAGLCAAWWLFPIGLLVWAVMLLIYANDPVLRVNYRMQERSAALSQRFQTQFDKITRSQVRLFNAINGSRRPLRAALGGVNTEVEALTDALYDLCQRMTGPENYVKVAQHEGDLDGQHALAVLALQGATDAKARKQKQQALDVVDERIQQMKAVAGLLDRVETQVGEIGNAMAAWMTEVVRLQALPSREATDQVDPLIEKIKNEREQLKEFNQELGKLP